MATKIAVRKWQGPWEWQKPTWTVWHSVNGELISYLGQYESWASAIEAANAHAEAWL